MLSKISNINKFRYLVSLYFVLAILDYYIMVDPMGIRYPPEIRRV
jgi:hypothetical protein